VRPLVGQEEQHNEHVALHGMFSTGLRDFWCLAAPTVVVPLPWGDAPTIGAALSAVVEVWGVSTAMSWGLGLCEPSVPRGMGWGSQGEVRHAVC
jgi:hypothetical protein